jgi:hypothetical protein
MQVAGESFEVAQNLEAGRAQAARAHDVERSLLALRVARDVGGHQHHLRKAGVLHRAQLGLQRSRHGDGVHAEMVEVHGGYAPSLLTTSSKVTPPR